MRHGGNQTKMTQMFRDWQERDAKRFTQYAAIPYHMLQFIDFTLPRQHILLEMRETFRVPESLCQSRLEQIERKYAEKLCIHRINEVRTWTASLCIYGNHGPISKLRQEVKEKHSRSIKKCF
nr:hypothetical protein [Parageobacillus thermoglucosidasius]